MQLDNTGFHPSTLSLMKLLVTLRCQLRYCLLVFALLASAGMARGQAFDLTVAQDGTGGFTTVQAAINAAPAGRTGPCLRAAAFWAGGTRCSRKTPALPHR